MEVAIVNYVYPPNINEPEELLSQFFTLQGWAQTLADQGLSVKVFQRFPRSVSLNKPGIHYYFIGDELAPYPRLFQIPFTFHKAIANNNPDIVHINGLVFPVQTWHLSQALKYPHKLIVQDHGDLPSRYLSLLSRICYSSADGFMFAAPQLERVWKRKKIIRESQRVFFVMEGSAAFSRKDRQTARSVTGMEGDPVFIWVGNLNRNKDPVTILDAFSKAADYFPNARLYMIFKETSLEKTVRDQIRANPALRDTVKLMGFIGHDRLEDIYNSANYFLLGSHKEGSGFAVLEAMACGVVPIIPDIPSFREITGQGRVGYLWQPGNPDDLFRQIQQAIKKSWAEQSRETEAYFRTHFSWPAIGKTASQAYRSLWSET